jgi:hypothetical protein
MVAPREEAGEGDIPSTKFSTLPLTPTLSPAGCGLARFRQILKRPNPGKPGFGCGERVARRTRGTIISNAHRPFRIREDER